MCVWSGGGVRVFRVVRCACVWSGEVCVFKVVRYACVRSGEEGHT